MDIAEIGVLLASTLRIAVPYVFASVGGFYSERAGIVNIALEACLLQGALACVLTAHALETSGAAPALAAWAGVAAAMTAGALTGALHALVCVRFGADQIVSGLGLNLLAMGATKFTLTLVFGSAANSSRIAGLEPWALPVLSGWGVTRVLFCTPLAVLAWIVVLASVWMAGRTRFGLRLHACGEHPEAAASLGVNVARLRWIGVVVSGVLASLGGAWLALDQHQFTAGMSSGRGFIALAALIFGKWTPQGAAAACLLFAFAEAIQIHLQGTGTSVPTQFLQMLPYLVTMVALAGAIGRSRPPTALGRPLSE